VFSSKMNFDEPSDKLTEVSPLGFWVGKVRPIVVWFPVRIWTWKQLESRTEAAFSYGNYTTFASKVLFYQRIESFEIGTWSVLKLIELGGPCWMAADCCIKTCGVHHHFRNERPFMRRTNCVFGQAREPLLIHGGCHR
jgi:hypothetical protein